MLRSLLDQFVKAVMSRDYGIDVVRPLSGEIGGGGTAVEVLAGLNNRFHSHQCLQDLQFLELDDLTNCLAVILSLHYPPKIRYLPEALGNALCDLHYNEIVGLRADEKRHRLGSCGLVAPRFFPPTLEVPSSLVAH